MSDSKTAVSITDISNLNATLTLIILEFQRLLSLMEVGTEIRPAKGETI